MTIRWLGGAAALPAMMVGQAMAAPPSPAYNWSGFYVGGNAGGGWGHSTANTTANCNQLLFDGPYNAYVCASDFVTQNGPLFNAVGAGTIDSTGFTGGAQVGYNLQYQGLVFGLETDFGAFQLRGQTQHSGDSSGFFGASNPSVFTITNSVSTDWLYTLRGRVGAPVLPNLLLYATGGLAVTRVGINTTYGDTSTFLTPTGAANYGASGVRTGWTIGAGVEWGFASQWSAKVEYLYLNFGSMSVSGLLQAAGSGYRQGLSTTTDLTAQIARVGINRHF
ncbi:MAG: outer membrane beta-barrel protein [Xanthobacteraceae bacterium]|nr:outer membrane beta-barrel protein [Xanthobacteraceae bacterium]